MRSIRQRLTLGLVTACLLLWGGGGVVVYLAVRAGLVAEFDQTLQANAQALTTLTKQSEQDIEFEFADELMPVFGRTNTPNFFQLWRADGTTLERSPSLRDRNLPRPAATTKKTQFWNLKLPGDQDGRAISIRFLPQMDDEDKKAAQSRSEVTLVVARHRDALDRRLNGLATVLLLVGASMAAVTVFVVSVVVRRGLQPLAQLAERAGMIDAASLQLRFPMEQLPAELLPIAGRLNELLARLEAAFERERQFSADVTHELRTPIAELRSLTEVALRWPDDAAATKRTLQEALAIALQMESVVTRLLALARCEAGQMAVRREPVAVAALVAELWESLAEPARQKNLIVTIGVPAEAQWEADPALLRGILANLLANAVEYCPAGGSVEVRFDGNELRVANATDNLSESDLSHLFERFWRKDPARSSGTHCGLGLALARAFARAMECDLKASLSSFTLTMTLARVSQS